LAYQWHNLGTSNSVRQATDASDSQPT